MGMICSIRKMKLSGIRRLPREWPILLLASLLVAGCVPTWTSTGEEIEKSRLADLKAGSTTKYQLLDNFGPPSAVIKPDDKTVSLPAVSVHHQMTGTMAFGGRYRVQPIVYLEVLGIKALEPEQRIYCFEHAREYVTFISGGIGYGEKGWFSKSELIVLVNEETELVEDFFYSD